ncbi:MAG: neutral/alkaline non-lysosomal ceramidase N-terminal domain-containing protein, partial [Anaerolineae bacterium]|nr:neutral/alkaline non-lysosomal ceramidase N-terminal domain-containing protein [Anaerolineae bacterium]
LSAGAARVDITPEEPLFLYGYPHVPRIWTGVHDPLYASALVLDDGSHAIALISVDVLMLSHETVRELRHRILAETGISTGSILISATHTHSAPVTCEVLAFRDDPVVPPIDAGYMARVSEGVVKAATQAAASRRPARVAITHATAAGVGGNRHALDGPSDSEVAVLAIRDADGDVLIALDLVYSMHPTVLHEDSTAVSADFPGFTRTHLAEAFPGATVVYHTGPSGNQSPRWHVTSQTFGEAERLGRALGEAVRGAVEALPVDGYSAGVTVDAAQDYVSLPGRTFPTVAEAESLFGDARAAYARLQRAGAPHGPLRTAEVAVFGAEECVTLATAQAQGEIAALLARYTPAEVQVLRVGDTFLVGLPGELFVEYGLAIKSRAGARAHVISLANGELQGYITTPDAEGYEAGISLLEPEAGDMLVQTAVGLIGRMSDKASKRRGGFTHQSDSCPRHIVHD